MRITGYDASVLDLRGLKCPLLCERIRKCLSRARPGELLQFICSDPLAVIDVPNTVTTLGDEVVSKRVEEISTIFVVRKSAIVRRTASRRILGSTP